MSSAASDMSHSHSSPNRQIPARLAPIRRRLLLLRWLHLRSVTYGSVLDLGTPLSLVILVLMQHTFVGSFFKQDSNGDLCLGEVAITWKMESADLILGPLHQKAKPVDVSCFSKVTQ